MMTLQMTPHRTKHTREVAFLLVCYLLIVVGVARGDEDRVLMFRNSEKRLVAGAWHTVVFGISPHRQVIRLVVPNSDPQNHFSPQADLSQAISGLHQGDIVEAIWTVSGDLNTLTSVKGYTPKPGELTPNGYIFMQTDSDSPDTVATVTLSKLGETTLAKEPVMSIDSSASVGTSATGNSSAPTPSPAANVTDPNTAAPVSAAPDPQIAAIIAALHPGDSVWVQLSSGPKPGTQVISAIMPYVDPTQGKLNKFTTVTLNGQKALAVEIAVGSATTTAVIPGKSVRGKWVPDAKLLSAAHRAQVGQMVSFLPQQLGDITWLREITPIAPAETASQQPFHGNDGPTDANGIPRGRTIRGDVPGVGGIGGLGGF